MNDKDEEPESQDAAGEAAALQKLSVARAFIDLLWVALDRKLESEALKQIVEGPVYRDAPHGALASGVLFVAQRIDLMDPAQGRTLELCGHILEYAGHLQRFFDPKAAESDGDTTEKGTVH